MKIAYFIDQYPVISETFIYNEILGFQNEGIAGEIFYFFKCNQKINPSQIDQITWKLNTQDSKIITQKSFQPIVSSFITLLSYNPIGFISCFKTVILEKDMDHLRQFIKIMPWMTRLIKHRFDFLYTHFGGYNADMVRLMSKVTRIPFSFTFETKCIFSEPVHILEKISQAKCVFFRNNYAKNYIINQFAIPTQQQHKLYINYSVGFDLSKFKPNSKIKKYPKFTIISVARLEEMKGFKYLIKAAKILKLQNFSFKCYIYGTGSLHEELQNQIVRLKLRKYVYIKEPINHSKIFTILNKTHAYILPSVIDQINDRDTIPYSIQESLAIGLPTIASNLGGIKEIASDFPGLYLTKPKDYQSIAATIIKISKITPIKLKSIENHHQSSAEKYFSNKSNSQRTLSILTQPSS